MPGLDEAWLSQVEIVTHAGPSRRLWMGPQFRFVPSLMPGCAAAQLFPTNSLHAATEIQRTGSDWDLTNGTNLQSVFLNFNPSFHLLIPYLLFAC